MNKVNIGLILLVTTLLSACGSSEPSEKEIADVLINQMKAQLKDSSGIFNEEDITINHIKKVGCTKAKDKAGYQCDIDIDVEIKLPFVGTQKQTGIQSIRFVNTDNGWSAVQ